jgi:hypothetical protein
MQSPDSRDAFVAQIRATDALRLSREFVLSDNVHALGNAGNYAAFRAKVTHHLPLAESVAVVGSGNWRYSLNPKKLLSEFHARSDIAVAVVSPALFHETWESMRRLHRDRWYTLDSDARDRLLRNGQNVYAGFACPTWLPVPGHPLVYAFKSMLGKLSGPEVGYREVKIYYYKSEVEMLDYYRRGFMNARRELRL